VLIWMTKISPTWFRWINTAFTFLCWHFNRVSYYSYTLVKTENLNYGNTVKQYHSFIHFVHVFMTYPILSLAQIPYFRKPIYNIFQSFRHRYIINGFR
jgi:hypothetical protein